VKSRKGKLEIILLTLAWLGFFVPLLWIVTRLLAFADYPLRPVPFIAGILCLAVGLWFFHRSHADLGTNWSITLEVREGHRLVTHGIYRHVRHPMYLALLLYSLGQTLVIPNWVAGPSYLVSFGFLFVLRVGPEERLMREEFGKDYESYMARTRRLVPGLW
jgi:protein-S-isoprenylcysteine O-methyltransferase Ste14